MPTLLPTVTATDYAAALTRVVATLKQQYPTLDLSPGSALEGLLAEQQAYLEANFAQQSETNRLLGSIQAIIQGQVAATSADVDALAANYFVTRRSAVLASGPVRVIMSNSISLQIPAGFSFVFGSLVFTSPAVSVWATSSTTFTENATNRRLTKRADGQYEFTLTVTASAQGSASRLAAGAQLAISSPLTGMVSASVAADFQGGTTAETDAELLARLSQGITAQTLAGPSHIQAALAGQFDGIVTNALGVGSPLVQRSQRNLLGVQFGGYQDIYYRVAGFPANKTVQVTGSVVDTARTVQFTLPRDVASGCYRVLRVRPLGSTGLGGDSPTSIQRSRQYIDNAFQPRYVTPDDVAFTAHQVITCQVTDSLTSGNLVPGQSVSYDVDVTYQPSCDSVTLWALDPSRRPAGEDLRIAGSPPCWVTVDLALRYKTGTTPPDAAAIAQRVSDQISAIGFGVSTLASYSIPRSITDLLGVSADVSSITLRGTINCPIGETDLAIPSSHDLVIPDRPDLGIGPDNVHFACPPSSVVVTSAAI